MKYNSIDYYRSVKIEESPEGFKVSVEVELFNYKTKEEIADIIYKAITKHFKGE